MDDRIQIEVLESPAVPVNDTKLYRRIRLPNGLEALLVCDQKNEHKTNTTGSSDADADTDSAGEGNIAGDGSKDNDGENATGDGGGNDSGSGDGSDSDSGSDEEDDGEDGELHAAVSCAVAVGSFCDPPESLGCAHFLEHLLFLGSEEYPGEASFSDLISEGGGGDNAYTESDETVYSFDIRPVTTSKRPAPTHFAFGHLEVAEGGQSTTPVSSRGSVARQPCHCMLTCGRTFRCLLLLNFKTGRGSWRKQCKCLQQC